MDQKIADKEVLNKQIMFEELNPGKTWKNNPKVETMKVTDLVQKIIANV